MILERIWDGARNERFRDRTRAKTISMANPGFLSYAFSMNKLERFCESRWALLALAFFVLLPYWNALPNNFLWDDEVLILGNPLIQTFHWDIFRSTLFGGDNYYRPLSVLTYLWDHTLFGLNSWGFHLTQNLWHVLVTLGFFLLLRLHFSALVSFAVALLYGLHPVHAAQVLALSGRNGILEGLWVWALLFLHLALTAPERRSAWLNGIFSALFFLFALLSKESAMAFPVLALLYVFLFLRGQWKRALPLFATYFLLLFVYGVFRLQFLPVQNIASLSMVANAPPYLRLWTGLSAFLQYIGLILFPFPLHTERHFVEESLSAWRPWLGLILLELILVWIYRSRRSNPYVVFGLGWFLVLLVPLLHFFRLPLSMAEHWLYLPLMGMLFVAAHYLSRLEKQKKLFVTTTAAILLMYTGLIFWRAFDYRDGFTLYSTDLQRSPNSFLLHTNYGVELFRRGEKAEAKIEFAQAVELMPNSGPALNNLGVIHQQEGELAKAKDLYWRSVRAGGMPLAYQNLIPILVKEGRLEEAQQLLQEARALYPNQPIFKLRAEEI